MKNPLQPNCMRICSHYKIQFCILACPKLFLPTSQEDYVTIEISYGQETVVLLEAWKMKSCSRWYLSLNHEIKRNLQKASFCLHYAVVCIVVGYYPNMKGLLYCWGISWHEGTFSHVSGCLPCVAIMEIPCFYTVL